jgi:hypothetical protein
MAMEKLGNLVVNMVWVETGSGHVEKLRCRRTHGGIAGLALGGYRLQNRCGRVMKRSAT